MNHPDAEDLTRTLRGPRTLLEMCLDLRMAHNGSADPISEEETAAALAYLRHRLATWKPSILPQGARFDMAVNELVKATIAEVEWRQIETARLLGSPAPQGPVTEADPLAGLPEAERARIVAGAANAMPENRARFVANSVAAYHARQSGVGVAIGREGQWFPQSTGTHTFGGRPRADCAPEALTREEAEKRLRALVPNSPPGAIVSVVRDARAWLRGNEKWSDIGDREINKQIAAVLAAHVRWLDAQKSAAEREPQ